MKHLFFFFCCFFFISLIHAQKIQLLTNDNKTSLRGLSAVDNNVIWVSGTGGKVAKSIDGGKNFTWITVPGLAERDFRDIEAFDANTALIMAVDSPAIILKTINGGKTWKEVFRDNRKGMFLDAMDFDESGNGIVVGDPMNNKLFIATTSDFGNHWKPLKDKDNFYNAATGEAFFASSGSNVKVNGTKNNLTIFFITGGTKSRLFMKGQPVDLALIQGKESQGANSLDYNAATNKIVVVGGDFSNINSSSKNCEILNYKNNKMLTTFPQTPPHGYKSCVSFIMADKLICCGWSGVDVSNDGGLNWKNISAESYNVCAKAKKGDAVFLAGKDGKIAKLLE